MFHKFIHSCGMLLVAMAVCFGLPVFAQVPAAPPVLLKNVTLIDGTGKVQKGVDIHILVNRIDAIGKDLQPQHIDKVIDGTGKFVIPGFIDARVQLGAVSPANSISRGEFGAEQRTAWLHALLRYGVVSVRLIQSDLGEQAGLKHWRELNQLNGPDIVTSGPTFTKENGLPAIEYGIFALATRGRETTELTSEDDARQKARDNAHAHADVFEISLTSGPDGTMPRLSQDEVNALVKEAHGHDLKTLCWVGHTEDAKLAVAGGCDVIEGMTEELFNDEILKEMAAKKIAFLPALVVQGWAMTQLSDPAALKAYVAQPDLQAVLTPIIKRSLESEQGRLAVVRSIMPLPVNSSIAAMDVAAKSPEPPKETPQSDTTAPQPLSFRQSYLNEEKRAMQNVKNAKAAGVTVITGTGAGSILDFPGASEHQEIKLLVESGLTPMEAIQAATANAAAALGINKEYGTIEKGKFANLLILDADPLADIQNIGKIGTVMRQGHIVNRDDMYQY